MRDSPEGLARLIEAVEALRTDLARPSGYRWGFEHCDRFHHLTGRRYTDVPIGRIRGLTEAVAGRFQHLAGSEGAGLAIDERRRWVIGELVGLIDAEVAGRAPGRIGADSRSGRGCARSCGGIGFVFARVFRAARHES